MAKDHFPSLQLRLKIMLFLQFFLWGAYLVTFGAYGLNTLKFTGMQVGAIYGTMGIASLFMPGILGILADRWISAEKLYGLCHLMGGFLLFAVTKTTDPSSVYWLMLLNSFMYMPTISLSNSICYTILEKHKLNAVEHFPPVRVWGTVGFIAAMWIVSLAKWELSATQLLVGSLASFVLGIYSFTLPACPPTKSQKSNSLFSALGLDALVLLKQKQMALFFLFAMVLGTALQLSNAFSDPFFHDFSLNPLYQNTFAVQYPAILLSLSQISETLFILSIPFFLRKLGIKYVMLLAMVAWVLRFALFGAGNPGAGLWMLVLSNIVYGMAFDFFNISGSLYVETESDPKIRASAQGLFMIVTNGIGAYIGAQGAGMVIDHFTVDGVKDWSSIWYTFAAYMVPVALLFMVFFKYEHKAKAVERLQHS